MNETPLPSPPASRRVALLRAAGKLLQAGILVYGLGVSAYLLARFTVGERWNFVAMANNFVPWYAAGGLALALLALFSRRRALLIACQLPGLIAFLLLYGDLLLPQPAHDVENKPVITVATYNTLSALSDPQRVVDVIADLDADVIGLQEFGPAQADLIAAQLADTYPYQALYPGLPLPGVGLLSRYPILEAEVILPYPDSMWDLRAVLDINGTTTVVYVVHPPPPKNNLSPVHYNNERRDSEITILLNDYIRHETGPVLVMGDFNATDQSRIYHDLDAVLDDAFREAGHGMGFTYPANLRNWFRLIPLVRIDYVWYSAHFAALDAWTGSDSGSADHLPVVAKLAQKGTS